MMNLYNESTNSSLVKYESLRIHPISDIFDPTKNYIGLISYTTGDIHIKQSDWIFNNISQRVRRRGGNYLHGRLFYFINRVWKTQSTIFFGGGFSYLDGFWKFMSRTLNTVRNDHRLSKLEEILVQVVIDNLYINHHWLEMPPEHRIDCQSLAAIERNNPYNSKAHPSNVDVNRKLHGTVKWLNNRCRLGYIECIGLDRDIYIHSTAVQSYRSFSCSGENVEFNVVQGCQGWKAENITAIWP